MMNAGVRLKELLDCRRHPPGQMQRSSVCKALVFIANAG